MKKSFAAVATASVLALGAVGFSAGPAAACGYTTCVKPPATASVPNTVPAGSKAKLKFRVAPVGNVTPTGTVKFVVKSKGFKFTKTKDYDGGAIKVKTGKLAKKGKYTVKITFIPDPGTIFNASSDKDTLVVN